MTKATLYPLANRTAQWFADKYPGATFSSMEKVLWHSTEGSGWPAYDGGAVAPNFTVYPDTANRKLIWRQHWPVNESSRALRHTRTQPTNGDHVVQIELIGTCVPGGPGMYWPNAPDWALQGLADFAVWMLKEWGVPLSSSVSWRPYGATGDWQRLDDDAYNRYVGHLGHEHAPQNDHRDVGALNMTRVLTLATAGLTGGSTVTPEEIDTIAQRTFEKIFNYVLPGSGVNFQTMIARTYSQGLLLQGQIAEADANDTIDVNALARAIVAALPTTTVEGVDASEFATAMAQEMSKRLAQ